MVDSITRTVRRRQLVDVAIEVIDEVGVERASLVRIGRHAGVNRGVITYHFDSRRALFAAVVDRIYELGREVVQPRTGSATTASAGLSAMTRGSIDFYARHPREMRVLAALFAAEDPDSPARDDCVQHRDEMRRLGEIVRDGQRDGRLRDCDVDLAADVIRTILDLGLRRIVAGENPGQLAEQLDAMIVAALRMPGDYDGRSTT